MDAEEFQAWKDSAATQWVLKRLLAKARRIESTRAQLLYDNAPHAEPGRWAVMQVQSSYEAGYVQAIDETVELEFEDIDDERNQPD